MQTKIETTQEELEDIVMAALYEYAAYIDFWVGEAGNGFHQLLNPIWTEDLGAKIEIAERVIHRAASDTGLNVLEGDGVDMETGSAPLGDLYHYQDPEGKRNREMAHRVREHSNILRDFETNKRLREDNYSKKEN